MTLRIGRKRICAVVKKPEVDEQGFSLFVRARDDVRQFANRTKNHDVGIVGIGWTDKTRRENVFVFLGEGIEHWPGHLGRFANLLKRTVKKPVSLRRCEE